MQPVLADLCAVEDEVRRGEFVGADALQDQGLAGTRVGDHHAFGAVGQVELLTCAVVAKVHHVGSRIEGDAVDLPDFVRARVDGAGCGGDAVFPGQRPGQILAQVVVDDRGEAVDGELTQRDSLQDRGLAGPRVAEAHAVGRVDDDEVVHGHVAEVELVGGRVEGHDVGSRCGDRVDRAGGGAVGFGGAQGGGQQLRRRLLGGVHGARLDGQAAFDGDRDRDRDRNPARSGGNQPEAGVADRHDEGVGAPCCGQLRARRVDEMPCAVDADGSPAGCLDHLELQRVALGVRGAQRTGAHARIGLSGQHRHGGRPVVGEQLVHLAADRTEHGGHEFE